MALDTIDLIEAVPGALAPLVDQFRRPITYLRISVTDRCNLRCVYCMPEEGLPWIQKAEILSFEEIERIVAAGAAVGVRSIRLTGGEPLVRRDLPRLVRMLAAIPGIDDIALSTNAMMLAEQVDALAAAGLRRVNISLDTLREDRFFTIARRRGLARVLAGIDAALGAGLGPIKINCVVMRGRNDDELADLAALTRERAIFVRFIELMPVEDNLDLQRDAYVSADEMLERMSAIGELVPVDGPQGNGPARYFAFRGAPGAVGVISPLSHDYCDTCNRVRLSADGKLRLCLFGDGEIDLRTPVRAGASRDDLMAIFRGSMFIKPERHHLRLGEQSSRMRAFSEIGG
ncbi:MAG: GTP 3',8-cyclase MoaA [Candidatus Elarobacter sp.]